jgi:hypothetical protein
MNKDYGYQPDLFGYESCSQEEVNEWYDQCLDEEDS